MHTTLNLLLVETEQDLDCQLRERLRLALGCPFRLVHCRDMATALRQVSGLAVDVDLAFVDVSPYNARESEDAVLALSEAAPDVPLLAIGPDDHKRALRLIDIGAQDYLYKEKICANHCLLRDAVEFALKRQKLFTRVVERAQNDLEEKNQVISWMAGGYSVDTSVRMM
ncbi:MAG: hypothetical protein KDJ15_05385 [Alphaproteobacteria bacterium]|nr:hypothetical protein [Alphaproteobacteria bacterium]